MRPKARLGAIPIKVPRDLQRRAQRRYAEVEQRRLDERYRRVLGRFVEAGYLSTNETLPRHEEPIAVAGVLWAGETEPRLLELLPALPAKQPSLLIDPKDMPEDLGKAVRRLRRNLEPQPVRGVSGAVLQRWLPEV